MSGLEYKKRSNRRLASEKQLGFTIIELMFTLAIASILLAIGIPSFQTLIKNNKIVVTSNGIAGAIAFARTEAIRRGNVVHVGEGTGNVGYRVWIDEDDDDSFDLGEEELRVWPANPDGVTVVSASSLTFYEFRGTGEASAGDVLRVCDDRTGERGNKYTLLVSGSLSRADEPCS